MVVVSLTVSLGLRNRLRAEMVFEIFRLIPPDEVLPARWDLMYREARSYPVEEGDEVEGPVRRMELGSTRFHLSPPALAPT